MSKVLINGVNYAWGQVQVVINDTVRPGITKVEYNRTGNHESTYAIGQEPYGYGYGNYTYTAAVEMYIDEWRLLKTELAGNPLGNDPTNITIFFLGKTVNPLYQNGDVLPYKTILYNCVFLEDNLSTTQGDTSIKVTIPLMISGYEDFI